MKLKHINTFRSHFENRKSDTEPKGLSKSRECGISSGFAQGLHVMRRYELSKDRHEMLAATEEAITEPLA